jgi:hypothetical protein
MASLQLFTASFRSFHLWMGQPVVISLQTPKWMDLAKDWPVDHHLTPRWSYFSVPDEQFDEAYLAQLNRFGPEKIRAGLWHIAGETGQTRLVLLCHEAKRAECHRAMTAEWLETEFGHEVPELTGEPRPQAEEVPFRLTDKGRQLVILFGRYTYAWPAGEEPVAVGDKVVVPGNRWRREPKETVVTGLGSTYGGELVELIGRAE